MRGSRDHEQIQRAVSETCESADLMTVSGHWSFLTNAVISVCTSVGCMYIAISQEVIYTAIFLSVTSSCEMLLLSMEPIPLHCDLSNLFELLHVNLNISDEVCMTAAEYVATCQLMDDEQIVEMVSVWRAKLRV